MKPFFYIGLTFIVLILFLQSATTENENYFTVTIVDSETEKPIKVGKMKIYPSLPLKSDEKIAGKGSHAYSMDKYSIAIIVAEAKGYKKEYDIEFFLPYKKHVIKMEKITEDKKPKEEKKKEKKEKEKKKIDIDLINEK